MSYFKPVRRKLGLLILAMASVLMAGWIRSFSVLDRCFFSQSRSMHALFSMDGVLSWRRLTPFAEDLPAGWIERPKWISAALTQQGLDDYRFYWDDGDVHWHWDWHTIGFDFGAASFEILGKPPNKNWVRRHEIWQIPYWSIVIPLILLSGWLLRPTRGERRPPPASEHQLP